MARKFNSRKKKSEASVGNDLSNTQDTKSPSDTTGSVETSTSGKNDPEWYAHDPQLLIDAGSLPFSEPFGSGIKLHDRGWSIPSADSGFGNTLKYQDDVNLAGQSGILVLDIKPSFGYNSNMSSPLNVAAHMLYTHVRYNNSGRKNYDQSDLMMYVGAIADMYSYIYWLKRIYNCAFMISQRNLYFGKDLLTAQRVDPDEVVSNLAQFRMWLNTFIAKVSTFVIPNSIELLKRRAFMYSNVYIDNSDQVIKDQLYLFNPAAFYIFDHDEKGKGMLRCEVIASSNSNTKLKLSDIYNIGNSMLRNVLGDEDFGIISGDILRSFQGSLIGISSQPEEGILLPIYDEFVLLQFKNADVMSHIAVGDTLLDLQGKYGDLHYNIPLSVTNPSEVQAVQYGHLYQDGLGNLQSREYYPMFYRSNTAIGAVFNAYAYGARKLITLDKLQSDPASVVEATRLKVTDVTTTKAKDANTAGYTYGVEFDCMSEVAIGVRLHTYSHISANNPTLGKYWIGSNFFFDEMSTEIAQIISQYHHAPYQVMLVATAYQVTEQFVVSDLINYSVQDQAVIANLNAVAKLSLTSVPGVSKIVN